MENNLMIKPGALLTYTRTAVNHYPALYVFDNCYIVIVDERCIIFSGMLSLGWEQIL